MKLQRLELTDFRSYHRLEFIPAEEGNTLIGPNGSGKTSVLEAIAYLSVLRSFRGTPDEALVRTSRAEAVIRGEFLREVNSSTVEVVIPREARRQVHLNGKRPRRHSDVTAQVAVVWFLTDDIDLVKRGPALRREFLDDLAAQLRPVAGSNRSDYERILRQRNAFLREAGQGAGETALDVFDEQLAAAGARLYRERIRVLENLADPTERAMKYIDATVRLSWQYEARWGGERPFGDEGDAAQALLRALRARRRRDTDQRTTTTGPHRDEPVLLIDERPVRTQASQGEQRAAAIALRIAAYRLLEEELGEAPVLLLDDVFSELDPARRAGVVELLPRGQVFVTGTRDDELRLRGTRWHVNRGTIT